MKRIYSLGAAILLAATSALHHPRRAEPAEVIVVQRHLAALTSHDVDQVLLTLADTLTLHIEQNRNGRDTTDIEVRDAQRERYKYLFGRFPDARYELLDAFGHGEIVTTREQIWIAGQPATGLTTYRVRAGRIRTMWFYASD